MDFALTEEQRLVRQTAREFAEGEIAPVAARFNEAGVFPWEIVRKLGELGFLGAIFPPEYGGAGLDSVSYVLLVEEIARADGSIALTVAAHNSLCSGHIYLAGTEAQRQKYLPRLARGEALGAWGLTEPGSGSDASAMKTTAVEDDAGFILNGTKAFITNGSVAEIAVVMAVTDPARAAKGISAFVLERGAPGFRPGGTYQKLGLHASDTAELILDNVRVSREQLLGQLHGGFVDTLKVLDGGRISIAAMAVGLAQGALDASVTYARERHAFGQPIGHFQGIQGMLAELATEIEAARLLTLRAAYLKDQGRGIRLESSMAKLFASEVGMKVTTKAIQIHGGYGYTREFPVERHFRDVKLCEIGEGTSEIQRLIIARQILQLT
ncbi:MAG: acyl-CoA dehydrogenase family protein [Candidatus Rokubacteria bacterium]|nr:acyl-CoA dehydrogenase family protein [Candidatus Rokubacteria bacterium]